MGRAAGGLADLPYRPQEQPQLAGVRFEPKELPSDSPAEYVAAGLQRAYATHEATIDLTGPEEGFAAMRHWYGAEVSDVGDGRRRLRLRSESLDWLAGIVAIFATLFDVSVVDVPEEALAMLADGARRLDTALGSEAGPPSAPVERRRRQ